MNPNKKYKTIDRIEEITIARQSVEVSVTRAHLAEDWRIIKTESLVYLFPDEAMKEILGIDEIKTYRERCDYRDAARDWVFKTFNKSN